MRTLSGSPTASPNLGRVVVLVAVLQLVPACTRAAPNRTVEAAPGSAQPTPAVAGAIAMLDSLQGDELLSSAEHLPAELRVPIAFELLRRNPAPCGDRCANTCATIETLTSSCTRDCVLETLLEEPNDWSTRPPASRAPDDIVRMLPTLSRMARVRIVRRLPNEQLGEVLVKMEPPLGDGNMVMGLSPEDAAEVFRKRPSLLLLGALDPVDHADLLLATAADRKQAPPMRLEALRRLLHSLQGYDAPPVTEAHAARLAAAFRALEPDPHCEVAALAKQGLYGLGDRSVQPVAPTTKDPAVMLRSVCMLAAIDLHDTGFQLDLYETYVGPAAITVVDTTDATASPRHVKARDAARLVRDLLEHASCVGAVCTQFDTRVQIELAPDPTGRLWIQKLVTSKVAPPTGC